MFRWLSLSALLLAPCLSGCGKIKLAAVNLPARFSDHYSLSEKLYGPEPGQSLHIYTPTEGVEAQVPTVLFFHGGRWQRGSASEYRFMGSALAKAGYRAILPNVRKYPNVEFPVFVQDAARAMAWVQKNVLQEGGQIALAGHSSGAHIAALLLADDSYLANEGIEAPSLISAFVGFAGPYHFTPQAEDLKELFGPPERYPQMQVSTFIDGNEPPMLLVYGLDDSLVGAVNHERLARAIRKQNGSVKVLEVEGAGHADLLQAFTWASKHPELPEAVFSFLPK